MMGAGNLAAADAAAERSLDEMASTSGRRGSARRMAGKLFVEQHGVWTDAAHQASFRTWDVAPFSDAYSQLVRALPEIAPYLKVGETVLVAGRRASIKVTAGGVSTWTAGELQAVVRAYRGA
jgi:hypothetical protein